jgi:hypothetical protein
MLSIDRIPNLTVSYRRAEVAGFWILGTVVVWLSIGLAAAAVGAPAPWAWGTAAALALVLPGLVWHPWFETGVWAWNGSVRRLAGVLRTCVLAAGYFILFAAVGRAASSRDQARPRPDSSGWLARTPGLFLADRVGSRAPENPGSDQGLSAFARQPGNRWAVTLIPIVFLLTLLRDDEQQGAVQGSTYTLY